VRCVGNSLSKRASQKLIDTDSRHVTRTIHTYAACNTCTCTVHMHPACEDPICCRPLISVISGKDGHRPHSKCSNLSNLAPPASRDPLISFGSTFMLCWSCASVTQCIAAWHSTSAPRALVCVSAFCSRQRRAQSACCERAEQHTHLLCVPYAWGVGDYGRCVMLMWLGTRRRACGACEGCCATCTRRPTRSCPSATSQSNRPP
jgi:hypothetical protein